jgi:hypothetical protein
MSYKAAASMKPILCILELSSDQALSSGDPINWSVQDGTSGHGVTVSSGVITLPSGHKWFAQMQVVPDALTALDVDWYVDNSASTLFSKTGISIITNPTSSGSNVVGHCYIDASSSSVDLESRVDATVTIDASFSFIFLIGYPA